VKAEQQGNNHLTSFSLPSSRARQSQAGAIADKADQLPKKAIKGSQKSRENTSYVSNATIEYTLTNHSYKHQTKMGLIGPYTLIRAISVFHITVAWFFLTAPRRVVDQNVVFMLGESMRLVSYAVSHL
jgi:hypothetical protein